MITAEQLHAAQQALGRARVERDELIRRAAAEGWGQHAIGRAVGMSQPAVRKILFSDPGRNLPLGGGTLPPFRRCVT